MIFASWQISSSVIIVFGDNSTVVNIVVVDGVVVDAVVVDVVVVVVVAVKKTFN